MRDFEQCFRNQRIINRPPARRVQGREDREAKIDILEFDGTNRTSLCDLRVLGLS